MNIYIERLQRGQVASPPYDDSVRSICACFKKCAGVVLLVSGLLVIGGCAVNSHSTTGLSDHIELAVQPLQDSQPQKRPKSKPDKAGHKKSAALFFDAADPKCQAFK
ncbi:MAG: hypothetical protein QNJ29_14600, partial [Rhizobiaceae bacterium]|nr:hypothetical protein [Rhizobiaceae bacterium]